MSPLKIMLLFEFPSLNGGEHSMLSCIKQLKRHTADCPVLEFHAAGPASGPLADQLERLDVPLSKFDTHDADGLKYSPAQLQEQMRRLLNSVRPDIVHSNSLSMSRNVGRMSDTLFQQTLRSGHLRDIIKLSRAAISDLNQNDGLVAVSNATRDYHVSRGLDASLCTPIYNGVDTEIFKSTDKSAVDCKCLAGLPENAVVVLNVGQICLRKGQRDLAEAIVNLLPEHPDLHLVLVGSRHSQKTESVEYEADIKTAFSNLGQGNHLHCLGYQSEVQELMNAADILVHVAKQEPLGRVLLEAAACELPIVATDVGGTSEIVTNQEQALLVSPDTTSIQNGIRHFLASPKDAVARAKSARARIQSEFTVLVAARQLTTFWQQLKRSSRQESLE
ncbi:MAG: glycosyltransferase family 4 protein [Fuerstiella sp.]